MSMPTQQVLKPGARVLVPDDVSWLYPATVKQVDNNNLLVKYDKGDVKWFDAGKVLHLRFVAVGSTVYCRSQGGRPYFQGTVAGIKGNKVHIQYSNGFQEWAKWELIRVGLGSSPVFTEHFSKWLIGACISLGLGFLGFLLKGCQ